MKFLILASKVKSLALASKPQVLENCPVLGSRTALFFDLLKFVGKRQKPRGKFAKTFFVFLVWRSPEKICLKTFLFPFWRTLAPVSLVLGPWPREGLSLKGLFLALDFLVSLASSLVSSTPLLIINVLILYMPKIYLCKMQVKYFPENKTTDCLIKFSPAMYQHLTTNNKLQPKKEKQTHNVNTSNISL